jgi:cell division protein FtsB
MTPEDKLNALFAAALEQQEAATAAIASLVKERDQLNATVESLQNTSKGLQKATGDAAAKAVKEILEQAPKTAATALNAATGTLDTAAGKVRDAGAWIGWKFALVFALTGAAAVLTNYAIGYFTQSQIADLRLEKAELRMEKAELEANLADLAKRGGRIKLSTCGPKNRLCVQITPKQGDAPGQTDYQGAWVSEDNKTRFAIPSGY